MFCIDEELALLIYNDNIIREKRKIIADNRKKDKLLNNNVSFFIDPDHRLGGIELPSINKKQYLKKGQ